VERERPEEIERRITMLKALMLRKKIDSAQKALEALRAKDAEFATREAELEQSIEEAAALEEGEEKAEAQKAVEEEVEKFEAEKKENDAEKEKLENDIAEMEKELEAVEKDQETEPVEKKEERKEMAIQTVRTKFFNMSIQERDAFFANENVKGFLAKVRTAIKEKRGIENAGLLIPIEMLGLLRENIIDYSKLYRRVNVRAVGGTGREIIMGTIPEAIWTECCANLNEVELSFNDVEVLCNKVGAYISVCNATLEDSDIDLAAEILDALGQAIGLALDKAILYGTGVKMPTGIVTRLAQTSEPADYPATARTWEDLHSTHILTIANNVTGANFFKQLLLDAGVTKGNYSRGDKVWCMNETTRTKVIAESLSINAAGAVVAGVNGTMPVIGGDIIVLEFIPDNVIIGGYIDLYLLAERRAIQLNRSEHYRFVQDQTVFKATARYDGLPVIAEAFVAIGIGGTTPSASMSFAPDTANEVSA
jgi:HK97 family phage major capsid protein